MVDLHPLQPHPCQVRVSQSTHIQINEPHHNKEHCQVQLDDCIYAISPIYPTSLY